MRAALKLGLQLVQAKLGQAIGGPGFSNLNTPETPTTAPQVRLPTSTAQIKDRSAKIQPPRVVTTR